MIAGIRNLISERSQEAIDFIQSIKLLSQHQISAYQSQNDQLMNIIKTHAQNQINTAQKNLELMKSTTQYFAQHQLKLASTQIDTLMRETLLQNPRNVLAKGYGIIRSDNKAIRSVQQVGAAVSIELQDGFIHADVNKVTNND